MCLRGQGEVRETCQEAGAGSKAREGVSRSVMSRLFVTPWTIALQAPLAMDFSRQKSWSGWPGPPLGDLPDPGIEPGFPALQADALPSEPPGNSNYCTNYILLRILTIK